MFKKETTAELLFADVFEELIIHHEQYNQHVIYPEHYPEKEIKKLKRMLNKGMIFFTEFHDCLICWPSPEAREAAQKTYTPETFNRLNEEVLKLEQ